MTYDDGMDAMIQGMIMGKLDQIESQQRINNARVAAENDRINAENQRIYDDLVDKYNELAFDSQNIAAQRDEAVAIIKENIDILPFSYDEARTRILNHGNEVERQKRRLANSQ